MGFPQTERLQVSCVWVFFGSDRIGLIGRLLGSCDMGKSEKCKDLGIKACLHAKFIG